MMMITAAMMTDSSRHDTHLHRSSSANLIIQAMIGGERGGEMVNDVQVTSTLSITCSEVFVALAGGQL